jgi:hypothetical protein
MPPNLADVVDEDLSADEETQERARRARREGAELDTDWEQAYRRYRESPDDEQPRFVEIERQQVPDPLEPRQTADDD